MCAKHILQQSRLFSTRTDLILFNFLSAKALPSDEAKSCDLVDRHEKDKDGLSNQTDTIKKLESENKELRHQIAKVCIWLYVMNSLRYVRFKYANVAFAQLK